MTKEELKKQLEERVARLEEEVRRQQANKLVEENSVNLDKDLNSQEKK